MHDLLREVEEDHTATGAAALAFYLMLALFPAAIVVLSLVPYLPVPHIDQAIMDLLRQALPGPAAQLFTGTVQAVVSHRSGSLLSFGLVFTLWSASRGMNAVIEQLNEAYDVKETRPFWKTWALALVLTLLFVVLIIGAFALVVFGGVLQSWIGNHLGRSVGLLAVFGAFRWVVIGLSLLLGFSMVYYLGPDVRQRFHLVTAGSVFGTVAIALASLGFRLYVTHFSDYSAVYGSLGAVIVLLMWLFITGWILLLGAELNALIEQYTVEARGTAKGESKGESDAKHPTGPMHLPA